MHFFFVSVFQHDSRSPFAADELDLSSIPSQPLEVSVLLIDSHLRKLKKGNGGSSGLPFGVFRNNSSLFVGPIACIFNNCFRSGRFPSVLKYANVVLIPKVNKPTEPCHFRPISMLPVLSKVMEKLF